MISSITGGDRMFGRIITAMVTPFDHRNNISYTSLKKLINHLIKTKTSTILLSGTTGEGMTTNSLEKQILIEKTLEYVDDRANVIMNIGSNCTEQTIKNMKKCEKYNLDGFLVVVPYYNRPPQEGIYQHFKTIAEHTSKPILIYNVPKRTSSDILPETVCQLSEIKNIVGIKEASGDVNRISKIKNNTKDFLVYTGDDALLYDSMVNGADGIVSVASHLFGDTINTIIQLILHNEEKEAKNLFNLYQEKFKALFIESNPIPLKEALNKLQFDVGHVRLPLVGMKEEDKHQLYEKLGI